MQMRGIPALPLLVLLASSCPAATLCVRQSAPGPLSDGTSWSTAYATVQSALSAASPGDEVWVAAGTYKENITLPSGVALYGGFSGTETSREQRNPQKNATILDGSFDGTVVTFPEDADSSTVLDGFTIRNGYGRNTTGNGGMGGGVYIPGGTPILSHNVITSNQAEAYQRTPAYGGGVYVAGGMPLIAENTISNNFATHGGGIYALGGLIRDNTIASNEVYHSDLFYNCIGGGIYMQSGVVAVHNWIVGNEAWSYGAGVYGTGTVVGNVFTDNLGHGVSAAVHLGYVSTLVRNLITDSVSDIFEEVFFAYGTCADNTIVTQSTTEGLYLFGNDYHGEPIVVVNNTIVRAGLPPSKTTYSIVTDFRSGEVPTISNNIVTGWDFASYTGVPSSGSVPAYIVDHNDSFGNGDNTLALGGGTPTGQDGNISVDPLFVDPAKGDYHLKAGSPCIDAGNDAVVKSGGRDLAGARRIAGAHVDIGAYEYGSPLYTVQDAATVLRIAAGISLSTPADTSRLDVAGEAGLTVTDATRIAQWLLN